jgi:formylglycine-generating enzyme required for sulfatase activity/tRNA A-37 threonylcarbamoyl transferase component Bud32
MSTAPLPASFGRNGAYKVVGVIGRGGFATVYKAYHAALDRHVAIKVLRPEMVEPEGARNRFQIEARASARLAGHPNIVTVYDYGEEEGSAYLVLQLVDGLTLEKRLHTAIGASEIDKIVTGVASALDFAHRNNLIHRDIKPSNVLLDKDGTAILSDFGIAKLLDATASVTNTLLGTPDYMSPEQITGSPLDGRSDVYALGVMVYRIFAGRVPYQGVPMSILHQHVHSPVPPISTPERPVSAAVEQVIQKAMAKRPLDRHATAGELATDLRHALAPMILADQAEEALRARDITRAEGIVAQLIRDHPSYPQGAHFQRQIQQWRAKNAQRVRLAAMVNAQDWQAAIQEIDRLDLRNDDDSAILEMIRATDAGLAGARARQEAARRAEQERQRQEALAAERRRLEALEIERRDREAREAARREREAQEAARREQEAREAAWREQEARAAAQREREAHEAAQRQWELQEAERLERERLQRVEQERLERAQREQAERDRLERLRQEQAERDRLERERAEQERLDRERRAQAEAAVRQQQEERQRELARLARLEALERQIDEEAGLPPAEVEARAAERHRRELARRGIEPAPEEAWEAHARSQRSPVLIWAISAVAFVALAVSAMAATGSLPFGLGGTATATPAEIGAGPTTGPAVTPAPPTQPAAQPKPAVTPATATPAASVPKPGVTPTSAPQPKPEQQGVPKPDAKPEATVPPSPTTPPAPLAPSIAGQDGAEMRLVRGGAFLMGQDGDPSTAPRHKLELPDFYVDLVEVTNARYAKFVEQSGFKPQGDWRKFFDPANFDPKFYDADRNEHPVVNVTWNDARSYCEWAGKRLPFEAEWEKAARGEDDRRWPWGNEPHPEFANVENNTEGEPDTKRVGSFPKGASPYGLQDMVGNVREWTASPLQQYPLTDPTGGTEGATSRVTRGGSWLSLPTSIELTRRLAEPVDTAAKDLGCGCAVAADQATRR